MTSLKTTALALTLTGAIIGGGVATALAATDAAGTATPARGVAGQGLGKAQGMGRGGMNGQGQGMKGGTPLLNMAENMDKIDFTAAGVSAPSFWGEFTTWLKGEDAKKVGVWLRTQMQAERQAGTKPAMPPAGGPLTMLSKIDFTAAGVSKPAFWDSLVTWSTSADATKVFAYQMANRGHERFEKLATELENADFSKAGISKPAFWNDLMTWLKGGDAQKLAVTLFQQRAAERQATTQN